jgi:hypothetical protein
MNIINGGAHADNNAGLPGVHGRAGRRAHLLRSAADGRRGLPRLKSVLKKPRAEHRGRRRGRLRPRPASNAAALARDHGGHQKAGYTARRGRRPRAGRGQQRSSTRTASYRSTARAARSPPTNSLNSMPISASATPSSASKTGCMRTTGTAGSADPGAWATACSSWATTSSSPTPPASIAAFARARQQHPHQGQPDRHAHRDPRLHRAGAPRGL